MGIFRLITAIIIIGFCFLGCTGRKEKEQASELWAKKGINLLETQSYPQDILKALDTALELNPHNKLALWGKAELNLNLGNYQAAADYYEQYLALEPDKPLAYYKKGIALNALGRFPEAKKTLEYAIIKGKILKDRRLVSDSWQEMAITYAMQDQMPQAVECLDKALAITPENARLWYNRGNVLEVMGKLDAAIKSYDKVLEHDPEMLNALSDKSWLLVKQKKYRSALKTLETALTVSPQNPDLWFYKGDLLEKMKKDKAALEAYRKMLALKKESLANQRQKTLGIVPMENEAELVWYPRRLYIRASHAALAGLEKRLGKKPDDLDLWREYGELLSERGQYARALEIFDRIIAKRADYLPAWYEKGFLLETELQNYDEALKCYEEVVRLKKNSLKNAPKSKIVPEKPAPAKKPKKKKL